MKWKIKWLLVCLFATGMLKAQTISGVIKTSDGTPADGVSVFWMHSSISTISDAEGRFSIEKSNEHEHLIFAKLGFEPDTIKVKPDEVLLNHTLKNASTVLPQAVISEKRSGNFIQSRSATKTEVISEQELTKAACCDLAGCFETQMSVQPQTTNILTNARELRILGVSGVYNQVLIDGMPLIQGLSYTYGISTYPGTLANNIFVAKGANTVIQGFDGFSGQINLIMKQGDHEEKLLLNGYINLFGEKQFNANIGIGDSKRSLITSVHAVQPAMHMDRDKDGFLDMPLITRYSIYQKLNIGRENVKGFFSRTGWRMTSEERIGGQTHFQKEHDAGRTSAYGQTVNYVQPELYTKTGYRWNGRSALFYSGSVFTQNQNSWYGTLRYNAKQWSGWSQLQYEQGYGEEHLLKVGVSYRHLSLLEDIDFPYHTLGRSYAGRYTRVENIPGIYAENTLEFDEKLTIMTGLRADHHNQFGTTLTPRSTIRWEFVPNHIVRASAGTGWRTVNVFSENLNLMASSRNVVFASTPTPERAFNTGINYTHNFSFNNFSGTFSMDYYYTRFFNQVFPDYDTQPNLAIIDNFRGLSASNALQSDLNLVLFNLFDVKLAYNFLDVFRKIDNQKMLLPFNARHRFLLAVSYSTINERWQFDMNSHYYGVQQLPQTQNLPEVLRISNQSKPYQVFNVQVTHKWKRWDFYAGCENLLDFRQLQPIMSWQDPFSPYFDTSFVWGPTRGREIYAGFRYKITRA
jgi:outer membrane receptor for ferrienterochelin and colicins